MTIRLHWAINDVRFGRWHPHNGDHPYGRTLPTRHGISVRCLLPTHPYAVSSTCRLQRDNWHNRIHHAVARYVAADRGATLEYGILACGQHLTNPLYTDEPVRLCDCGKGDASICPRCELAVHPDYLHQPCGAGRRRRAAS